MNFLRDYFEEIFVSAAGDPRMLIAQLIGVAAMILMFVSYHRKSRGGIVFLQMIALILWTVHFFLLRAYVGCILNAMSVFRNAVYMQQDKKKWAASSLWVWFFSAASVGIYFGTSVLKPDVGTTQKLFDLLPVIATVIANVGLRLKQARQIRLVCLFCSPLWLTYNIFNQSIGASITEFGSLISNGIAIIRLDILKKGDDPAEKKEA